MNLAVHIVGMLQETCSALIDFFANIRQQEICTENTTDSGSSGNLEFDDKCLAVTGGSVGECGKLS